MKKSLFFTKRFSLLIGFVSLLVCSCRKSDNHLTQTVPLKANFQETLTIISPGGPGVLEHAKSGGSGSGQPIGNATIGEDFQIDVTVLPEIINGVDTITTATGDKIFSTFTGTSPAPDAALNFQVFNKATITGGTGKFAGATGNFTITINGNFKNPTQPAIYDGTITY